MKAFAILLLAVVGLVGGCATTPQLRVWRPWMRVNSSEPIIPINSKVSISVLGKTSPLLGDEALLQKNVRDNLVALMERRGFQSSDKADYLMELTYQTEAVTSLSMQSEVHNYSSNNYLLSTPSGNRFSRSFGAGVTIANAILAISSQASSITQTTVNSGSTYRHVISIEILSYQRELLWKGESTWESEELDIEKSSWTAIQMLLSGLPKNETAVPSVQQIQKGKEINFFRLECDGTWFSCPALPYKIVFASVTDQSQRPESRAAWSLQKVKRPEFLPAYIDLLQTAEFALPVGQSDYSDPLSTLLWSEVKLGGVYKINNEERINVMIELVGESAGYVISNCWIPDNKEFSDFLSQMETWKKALAEYQDVYVH